MDTKLRNYNKTGLVVYWILWCIEVVTITGALLMGSMYIAIDNMGWFSRSGEDHYWYGTIHDTNDYNTALEAAALWTIINIIAAVIILVVLMVMVGQFNKTEDGRYKLNWIDRIWSELLLVGGIAAGTSTSLLLSLLHEYWIKYANFSFWTWSNPYEDHIVAEDAIIIGLIAAEAALVIVTMLCLLSLVKKIKARQLWEKSLLGGSFLAIYRGFKNNDRVMAKIMVALIIGAILCATWFGLPIVLILIILIVPKSVKKYIEIRKGVEEVRNGNLNYVIPVNADAKGIKGELDRLAEGINDISHASSIAVQNELKNQRMKTDLISNVSHDLKTPLTSMISYVHLMKEEGLDSPNAPEYLEILDKKTQRLKSLTENLFEAAKASSGNIPVNIEEIDLEALLTQSLGEMEERLALRNLDVHVKNMCDSTRIYADGQLMWRVIENLLGNISKYALEGSRVYINMKDTDNMVLLEVKNISQEALNIPADELMERFKRGDESRNTEGSGLGLAIAKDLVKLMDGVFEISIDGDLFKATILMKKAN
ncbi:MAG: HAMP domain-containing histidine kinase [Firmicutes bacterium]|nr:HAMP domain-containing histidine kinase [Bacillota bacterium]